MKKIIFALIIPLIFVACNSNDKALTPDEIRNRINEYKAQIKELNTKISELKSQLEILENGGNALNAVKVNTVVIKPVTFKHYFQATGSVEAVNEAYVSPQLSGEIVKIAVEEGDNVKKGQLLAKLDTQIIENNIKEIETSLELAKVMYEKQKELWSKKIGSEIQYLQAKNKYESLKQRLATLRSQYNLSFIKSPIDGYIDDVSQKLGEIAVPGRVIFHVVNLNDLLIKTKVSEVYLNSIKKGDSITVSFPSIPEMSVNTVISRLGQVINPSDRTFTVETKIKNRNNSIKPNMLATLTINDYTSGNSIVIPSFIIREDIKGYYIYVAEEKDGKWIADKRYIKTGKSYKGNTEVLEGLKPGERVITDGYNNVSTGQVVVFQK